LKTTGEQSPDINQGVDLANSEIGAGDQGLMFGTSHYTKISRS